MNLPISFRTCKIVSNNWPAKSLAIKVLGAFLPKEALQDFLTDGLSQLLNSSLQFQRKIHLDQSPEDRANGYAPQRTIHLGTTPIEVQIPRSRNGFYPPILPKYRRQIGDAYADLLRQILTQAKSFKSAVRILQSLGLGYSQAQIDELLNELYTEAKNFNLRPLSADWYAVFIDAKVIHLKDEHDHVLEAIHFLVIGYGTHGKKEVLTAATFWGKEQLESWRKMLLDLKNRALTRCLLFVTDDFSGLAPLLKSLYPGSQHQLCTVHLHRNAFKHLDREDYQLYKQAWREIWPPPAMTPPSSASKACSTPSARKTLPGSNTSKPEPNTTWPSFTIPEARTVFYAPPTFPKASITSSRRCVATPVATSIPNEKPWSK